MDEILIFEGEVLRGKLNGKGKEYNNGRLIFEGEYLNGLKINKGKEYYDNYEIYSKFYANDDFDSEESSH